VDQNEAARAVVELLRALGYAPEGELADTPALVAEAWCNDLLAGAGEDPVAILRDGAVPSGPTDRAGLVVLRDLAVTTICPHHLLPAHGQALVAYLPGERVVGFGAVSRAVAAATRRLTLQERATHDIAAALVAGLGAKGALCRLELVHTCMIARGARDSGAVVETVALEGTFAESGADRDLAITMLSKSSR
jgi:GTP cyclohydrolase IA